MPAISLLAKNLFFGFMLFYIPTKLSSLFFFGKYGKGIIYKPLKLLLISYLIKMLAFICIFAILSRYFYITTIDWQYTITSYIVIGFILSFFNLFNRKVI
jgi:hypothetical protein